MAAASAIESCFVVEIHNATSSVIKCVKVSGGGCEIAFGDLPVGSSVQRRFWLQGNGRLILRGARNNSPFESTVEDYVTNSHGGTKSIEIHEDGIALVK